MPLKMKDMPESERPYEKLKMYGAEKLSNAELLAIIIKTGTKDETSLDLAKRILRLYDNLNNLGNSSIEELKKINGIGEVKAIQILATCELTKRISKSSNTVRIKITSPKDVANLLMDEMKYEKQEIIKAIILDTKNFVVKIKDVVVGDTNCASVTQKQIFAENIKLQEPKLILVHNHPSGNSMPSKSDILFTEEIIKTSKILGIEFLDHIVIGNNEYKSIISLRG